MIYNPAMATITKEDGTEILLTKTQNAMVDKLSRGQMLVELDMGDTWYVTRDHIKWHVALLRKKLGDPKAILNHRGFGYYSKTITRLTNAE